MSFKWAGSRIWLLDAYLWNFYLRKSKSNLIVHLVQDVNETWNYNSFCELHAFWKSLCVLKFKAAVDAFFCKNDLMCAMHLTALYVVHHFLGFTYLYNYSLAKLKTTLLLGMNLSLWIMGLKLQVWGHSAPNIFSPSMYVSK